MKPRGRYAMPRLRSFLLAGVLGLLATCSGSQPPDDLPEVVYICPMVKDADVLESHAGKCPKCGMELKPVRIVTAYTCLSNTAFIQDKPGKCVTNGTDLVPITASMFWICPSAPDKRELEPGKCGDGSDRIKRFEPRLHGDHNPRHGGQLFMADDGWHHVEGTHPASELFRVFFYDDWTRPLQPKDIAARLILKDSAGKELKDVPLQASSIANAMEVKLPAAALPLSASLRVRFKTSEPEKLFDFTFRDYSKDPLEPAPAATPPPVAPAVPPATTAVPAPAAASAPTTTPVSAQPAPPPTAANIPPGLSPTDVIPVGTFQMEPIPTKARDVLAELSARDKELSDKISQRAPLGEYWVPALRTKDLALALLSDHLQEIPSRQRAAAENAVSRLIRSAYAIDNFGDLGEFEKILSAHAEFLQAVNDLKTAYASIK